MINGDNMFEFQNPSFIKKLNKCPKCGDTTGGYTYITLIIEQRMVNYKGEKIETVISRHDAAIGIVAQCVKCDGVIDISIE